MMKRLLYLALGMLVMTPLFAQKNTFTGTPARLANYPILKQQFSDYKIYALDVQAINQAVKSSRYEIGVNLQLGDDTWKWQLEPHDIRSADYQNIVSTDEGIKILPRDENKTYRGRLLNDQGGNIAMTVDADFLFGFWEQGNETYYIEPLWRLVPNAGHEYYLVYTQSKVKMPEGQWCGWSPGFEELYGRSIPDHKTTSIDPEKVGNCYNAEIALAGDFQMVQALGSVANVTSFMLGVLNNVQTNYDNEFADQITFVVATTFVVASAAANPWTNSNNAGTLLDDFRDWGNNNGFQGVVYDLASLWTNRDFTGSTIGVAWLGGLCTELRYNTVQNFSSSAALLRVLQAHEIGHLFNADHDASSAPFIMAPAVLNTNSWSPASISDINNYISAASGPGGCLSSCGGGSAPPVAGIIAPATHICPGTTIPFIDNSSGAPSTWDWFFPGGSPGSATIQNPTVRYDNIGDYPVTLIVSNNSGSDATALSTNIVVDNQGTKYLMYETFEGGPVFWEISNPDNGIGWEWTNVGGTQYGKKAMVLRNFDYTNLNQSDYLISAPLDFSNESGITLLIDYAYKRFNASNRDRLRIQVSTNGGQTYPFTLFDEQENGSGNLATAPDSQSPFTPSVINDWCYGNDFGADCIMLDLSNFAGQSNVRIRIMNTTGHGNNLYIDNVRITADCQTLLPPIASFSGTPTLGCAPLTVHYQDHSTGVVTSRQWNFPGGNPATSSESSVDVVYTQPGTYSATLRVTNAAGTDLAVEGDYIIVLGPPQTAFTSNVMGMTVSFTNQSVNANTYLWNFGDGMTSTQFQPSHTYSQPGTYTVRLTATNECGSKQLEKTVTIVNPLTAAFNASQNEGCAPLSVSFTDASVGNPTGWAWSFPGGSPSSATTANPSVTYDAAGTYIVTLVISSGASQSTITDTIVVNGLPTAGFNAQNTLGQTTASFNNTSQNASVYFWDFGDGDTSIVASPTHDFGGDGDYDVLLIATNACGSDTSIQTITILTPPQASFTSTTASGCAPMDVTFTAAPQGPGLTYTWTFEGGSPDTSTDAEPTISYDAAGTYEVSLIVTNAAGSDTMALTSYVSINGGPLAAFNTNSTLGQTTAAFENNSQNADEYFWDFGDGDTSLDANPSHDFGSDGDYSVMLIATNACGSDTAIQTITILTPPQASFTSTPATGCSPFDVTFTAAPQGPGLTYAWTFEGGNPGTSTDAEPTISYDAAGTYEVSLIVTNAAGSDTMSLTSYVSVNSGPSAAFTINSTLGQTTADFNNDSQNAAEYFWDFGDGATSLDVNPSHDFGGDGDYSVLLIATNACGSDTSSQTITILTTPHASFTSTTASGCAPFEVTFTAAPQGPGLTYAWTFEGGTPTTSTDAEPTISYDAPGTYGLSLIVTNAAGSDTMTMADFVVVNGGPSAAFNITSTLGQTTADFDNNSQNADEYFWDFGDGGTSSAANPSHDFGGDGDYVVLLIAYNACGSDTSIQTISILTPPQASFTNTSAEGCSPLEVTFSAAPQGSGLTYAWTFDGGTPTTSADANPTITYNQPGSYDVMLEVSNAAGSSTAVQQAIVVVKPEPTALFTGEVNGQSVQFVNNSVNATSFEWQFGDNTTSTDANPSHHYDSDGDYTVTLVAFNDCGSNVQTTTLTIDQDLPVVDFTTSTREGCGPLEVQFNSQAVNADSLAWTFPGGTPSTSNDPNPTVVYNTPGTYSVGLTAFNNTGSASLTHLDWIEILPATDAGFSFDVNETTVQFSNTSTNATIYEWHFGDGETSNEAMPSHTFGGAGDYIVTLYASGDCGVDSSQQVVSIVGSAPTPGFTATVTQGCAPFTVTLNDASTGSPTSWMWSFPGGNPDNSTEINPTVVYNTPGTYSVSLSVSNGFGSQQVLNINYITVLDAPQAAFDYQSSVLEVSFSAQGSIGTSWDWNFGDGTTGAGIEVSHTYSESGTYEVTLVVSNECGSDTIKKSVQVIVDGLSGIDDQVVVFNLYPNPNNGQFTLELGGLPVGEAYLTIINPLGQLLSKELIQTQAGITKLNISRQNWPAGVYFCRIDLNGQSLKRSFVIQR